MKEYIELEAAIEKLNRLCDRVCQYSKAQRKYMCGACPLGDAFTVIEDDIPAADVRPVVRGKWEQKEVFEAKGYVDELQSAFCPVCQRYHTTPYSYYFTQYNFCPNCGADMREES